ncbi:MAG: DUF2141 domain-containing protein [Cyclobacteriaceae bacterium]
MKKLTVLFISIFSILSAKSQTVNVTVTVSNVSSNEGIVQVCVFDKADAFPQKTKLAVKCVTANATKGTMKIQVDGLAPGSYALAVHHDKNNDGKFNTNFFGIPTEASGATKGAKGKMGPPKYSDAVLVIDKKETQVAITIQ